MTREKLFAGGLTIFGILGFITSLKLLGHLNSMVTGESLVFQVFALGFIQVFSTLLITGGLIHLDYLTEGGVVRVLAIPGRYFSVINGTTKQKHDGFN